MLSIYVNGETYIMQWTMLDVELCFETDKMPERIRYSKYNLNIKK